MDHCIYVLDMPHAKYKEFPINILKTLYVQWKRQNLIKMNLLLLIVKQSREKVTLSLK